MADLPEDVLGWGEDEPPRRRPLTWVVLLLAVVALAAYQLSGASTPPPEEAPAAERPLLSQPEQVPALLHDPRSGRLTVDTAGHVFRLPPLQRQVAGKPSDGMQGFCRWAGVNAEQCPEGLSGRASR